MTLYDKIVAGEEKIALVGLGYIGIPIAVAFAKKTKVIGFDLSANKIELYKSGIDPTQEIGSEGLKASTTILRMKLKDLVITVRSFWQAAR